MKNKKTKRRPKSDIAVENKYSFFPSMKNAN